MPFLIGAGVLAAVGIGGYAWWSSRPRTSASMQSLTAAQLQQLQQQQLAAQGSAPVPYSDFQFRQVLAFLPLAGTWSQMSAADKATVMANAIANVFPGVPAASMATHAANMSRNVDRYYMLDVVTQSNPQTGSF